MKKGLVLGSALATGLVATGLNFASAAGGITTYEQLKDCLESTFATVCNVDADINADAPIIVTSAITLNLNGKTLGINQGSEVWKKVENKDKGVITVNHGADLTVNGEGTITTGESDVYAAIRMTGETEDSKVAKLTVNNTILTGYYYGVVGNGSEHRGNTDITINGSVVSGIAEDDNFAMYLPQAGKTMIINSELSGASGIAIKSGSLTINDSSVEGVGLYHEGRKNDNGAHSTGAGIQIETNTKYTGEIQLEINGFSSIKSKNSHAIYEFLADPGNTALTKFQITRGILERGKEKSFVELSTPNEKMSYIASGSTTFFNKDIMYVSKLAEVEGLKEGDYVKVANKDANELTEEQFAKIAELKLDDLGIAAVWTIDLFDVNDVQKFETNDFVTFEFELNPEMLADLEEGYTRNWYLLRFHNDELEKIPVTVDLNTMKATFKTTKFSDYVLAYVDAKVPEKEEETAIPSTPNSGFMTKETSANTGFAFTAVLSVIMSVAFLGIKKFAKKNN